MASEPVEREPRQLAITRRRRDPGRQRRDVGQQVDRVGVADPTEPRVVRDELGPVPRPATTRTRRDEPPSERGLAGSRRSDELDRQRAGTPGWIARPGPEALE